MNESCDQRYTNCESLSRGMHTLAMGVVQNTHDRHKRKAYKRKSEYIALRRSNATNHSQQKTINDTLQTVELWLPGSQSGVNRQLIKRLAERTFDLNICSDHLF